MNLKRESPEQVVGINSSGSPNSRKKLASFASGIPSISMRNHHILAEQHHLPHDAEQKFPAPIQQGADSADSNIAGTFRGGDSPASISSSSLDPSDRRTIDLYNNGIVSGPFPLKLQTILKIFELEQNDLIKWQPHGRAFSIRNKSPKEFQEKVMARFFHNTKVTSFFRQINIYDFVRITSGPDAGCYYHEMFLRGKPLLACRMVRNSVKGAKTSKKSSPPIYRVPDFYALPPMPPLGSIDNNSNASAKKTSNVASGQLQFGGNNGNRSSLSPTAGLDKGYLQQLQLLLGRENNSDGSAARNEGGFMWADQKIPSLVAHRTQQDILNNQQFSTAELLAMLNSQSLGGNSQGLGNSVFQMPADSDCNIASLASRLLVQPSLNVLSNSDINKSGQIMSLLSALSPTQQQPQQQFRTIYAGITGLQIPQQQEDILYRLLSHKNPASASMMNQNMMMAGAANHFGTTDAKNPQENKFLQESMLFSDRIRCLGLGMNDASFYQQQNQNLFVRNNSTPTNNMNEALLALLMSQQADKR